MVLDDVIIIRLECLPTFLVVKPREWIVELGQCGPMEIFIITTLRKVSRGSKRLRQVKALDACFFEWVVANDFIELDVVIVGAIKGLEGDQFERVRQKC
jgi:hypothetical protein